MSWRKLIEDTIRYIQIQEELNKDKECDKPGNPFDWAHRYEHQTIYRTPEKINGYTVSVCKKCGYEHPLSVTYFAQIPIPLRIPGREDD